MIIVERKIKNLKQFAIEHNHSVDFRIDKNNFWIGIYIEDGCSSSFSRGFHGNFNDKNGRNLDDIIRQSKIFIENNVVELREPYNKFIGETPIA